MDIHHVPATADKIIQEKVRSMLLRSMDFFVGFSGIYVHIYLLFFKKG